MVKKKTVSQELTDLLKPQSFDYDIEDSERINNDEEDGGSNDEEDDEELKKQHYIKMDKSNIRKDEGLIMDGVKYQGSNVSRKELFDNNNDLENNIEDEDNSEDNSEGYGEPEEEQENKEEENESDPGADLSAENSESDFDSEPEAESNEINEYKRNKIKSLVNNESQTNITRAIDASKLDGLKGYYVLQQQSLYDQIVDSRIKFQKSLNVYNQLPVEESAIKIHFPGNEKYFKKAESSLYSLLDSIHELRYKLFEHDKVIKSQDSSKFLKLNKKRNLSEYLSESQTFDKTLNIYRNAVLTKWSQKISSASGSNALNASKFKTINQTAAIQVENNLANKERLLKRTRLNRKNIVSLGNQEALQEDEKIFDDEDFYRVLLRDLIDKKVNSNNNEEENILTLTNITNKFKKNVDTKASKGRKLNFKPQEPILNYMAPNFRKEKWDDFQIDEFFAGLLGQKINMNEDIEEEEIDERKEIEKEILANDDIQLFG